ncbi:MAG TPA: IPT/TIG domain-containing protein [Streptosporangiaceae bacterium]|nr:IPT/TIG domain-containing protein [Streptosporangiaceae bacterium]
MSVSATSPHGLSLAVSYWLALGVLIVLLVLLAFVARAARKAQAPQDEGSDSQSGKASPFWYVVLGADNRVSTSKVQFALWTVALAYALLVIAFHDAVYPPGSLDPRYLLLIGFPAGAAVSAKAITTGQINSGSSSKTTISAKGKSLGTAISEIVSNDQGDLDLGDTQYFVFNLVALVAFFIAFFHNPVSLPVLPDTLVGLTSASAAAYVAKKATVSAAPAPPLTLTAVSPQQGAPGTPVTVFGSGIVNTAAADGGTPAVTIGGLTAPSQAGFTATMVPVTVPTDLKPGKAKVDVQVVSSDGRAAVLPAAFEVTAPASAPDPQA